MERGSSFHKPPLSVSYQNLFISGLREDAERLWGATYFYSSYSSKFFLLAQANCSIFYTEQGSFL